VTGEVPDIEPDGVDSMRKPVGFVKASDTECLASDKAHFEKPVGVVKVIDYASLDDQDNVPEPVMAVRINLKDASDWSIKKPVTIEKPVRKPVRFEKTGQYLAAALSLTMLILIDVLPLAVAWAVVEWTIGGVGAGTMFIWAVILVAIVELNNFKDKV
jgi:hypothetical protein